MNEIGLSLKKHYEGITAGGEEGGLSLRSDPGCVEEEEFMRKWAEGRDRDFHYGSTQRGPHRDELELTVKGRGAREYGSEGQQRGLVLALRLAQVEFFRSALKQIPVLLADDIVNELDPARRRAFWGGIPEGAQLIATGTELPQSEGWQVFSVAGGAFTPR